MCSQLPNCVCDAEDPRLPQEFMCECCDEYPAEPGFTECKYCRITYATDPY